MNGIIVYESKNGATAEYAGWLSEATGLPAVPARKAGKLERYDLVVVGSCVRMYKPTLAPWLLKRWPVLSTRKAVLFTVAGAPAADPLRERWVREALGDAAAALPHFPLEGRMVFDRMRPLDRFLMKLAVKMVGKKNPEEAAKMGAEFDKVDRASLKPLLDHLAKLGVAVKAG